MFRFALHSSVSPFDTFSCCAPFDSHRTHKSMHITHSLFIQYLNSFSRTLALARSCFSFFFFSSHSPFIRDTTMVHYFHTFCTIDFRFVQYIHGCCLNRSLAAILPASVASPSPFGFEFYIRTVCCVCRSRSVCISWTVFIW